MVAYQKHYFNLLVVVGFEPTSLHGNDILVITVLEWVLRTCNTEIINHFPLLLRYRLYLQGVYVMH
jgi:hypothetical protein